MILGAASPTVNISDIIGFIIAFLAFIYMTLRPLLNRKSKQNEPFEDELDEDEEFYEQKPVVIKKAPPLPAQQKKWDNERFDFQTSIEKRHKPSAVEQRKLDSAVAKRKLKELEASFEEEMTEEQAYGVIKEKPSQALSLIKKNTLRGSLLAAEILGEPRASRLYDGRPHGL